MIVTVLWPRKRGVRPSPTPSNIACPSALAHRRAPRLRWPAGGPSVRPIGGSAIASGASTRIVPAVRPPKRNLAEPRDEPGDQIDDPGSALENPAAPQDQASGPLCCAHQILHAKRATSQMCQEARLRSPFSSRRMCADSVAKGRCKRRRRVIPFPDGSLRAGADDDGAAQRGSGPALL
jgi:hypothetical protein